MEEVVVELQLAAQLVAQQVALESIECSLHSFLGTLFCCCIGVCADDVVVHDVVTALDIVFLVIVLDIAFGMAVALDVVLGKALFAALGIALDIVLEVVLGDVLGIVLAAYHCCIAYMVLVDCVLLGMIAVPVGCFDISAAALAQNKLLVVDNRVVVGIAVVGIAVVGIAFVVGIGSFDHRLEIPGLMERK